MKIAFKHLLALMSIGLFLNCSEPETDSIVDKSVEIRLENLIQIETVSSYKLNDLIYINSKFSRYLPEKGYKDLLDIYKTTKSNEYNFNFILEKKSAYGSWSQINFGDKIVVSKGKSYSSYSNVGICVLNTDTNQYEFRAGIPLLETGEFRINISTNLNPVFTNDTRIPVYISTTISAADLEGFYKFSVNE